MTMPTNCASLHYLTQGLLVKVKKDKKMGFRDHVLHVHDAQAACEYDITDASHMVIKLHIYFRRETSHRCVSVFF